VNPPALAVTVTVPGLVVEVSDATAEPVRVPEARTIVTVFWLSVPGPETERLTMTGDT